MSVRLAIALAVVAMLLAEAPPMPSAGVLLAETAQEHSLHASHEGHGVSAGLETSTGGPEGLRIATDLQLQPSPIEGLPLPSTPGTETGEDESRDLPNLVPLPAYDIEIGQPDATLNIVDGALETLGRPEEVVEGPVLRFTTTIFNKSEHSFDLLGLPGPPDTETDEVLTTEAYQCVRWEGPPYEGGQRVCGGYEEIGTLTYHAHHRHFHINGFAKYQLRRDDRGLPMHGPGSVIAESSKVGWCVSDMERPRDADGEPLPYDPWYRECSGIPYMPVSFRQGISPGWGDTYYAGFTGQQIPISGIPDGVYWISIWMNPPDNPFNLKIRETNLRDNISYQRIRLSANGTVVEVL